VWSPVCLQKNSSTNKEFKVLLPKLRPIINFLKIWPVRNETKSMHGTMRLKFKISNLKKNLVIKWFAWEPLHSVLVIWPMASSLARCYWSWTKDRLDLTTVLLKINCFLGTTVVMQCTFQSIDYCRHHITWSTHFHHHHHHFITELKIYNTVGLTHG